MTKYSPIEKFIGKKYNFLKIISFSHEMKGKKYFKCKCDCGNKVIRRIDHLVRNESKSCGCIVGKQGTHLKTNTRLYETYCGMKKRCYNKKSKSYKHYGAKGIKVCNEWLEDFSNFYDWAYKNGYNDELTIDRINVNKGYSPENCKWSTRQEQSYNKTTTHYFEYKNERKSIAEWSKITGIKSATLLYRINHNWDKNRVIEEPVRDY